MNKQCVWLRLLCSLAQVMNTSRPANWSSTSWSYALVQMTEPRRRNGLCSCQGSLLSNLCQMAQDVKRCQGIQTEGSPFGLSLSLLVEGSRLSSPFTGRVEILNLQEERRSDDTGRGWWTIDQAAQHQVRSQSYQGLSSLLIDAGLID